MEKHIETPEAKLRNAITPIYGLVDMVLLLEETNLNYDRISKLLPIIINEAKQCEVNKNRILDLLVEIESK